MMAGSDLQMLGGGLQPPREACTIDIESSTVTDCGPVACMSISVRPRQGRMNDCLAEQQVRAIEFGGDMHGEIEVAHRLEGDLPGRTCATARLPPRQTSAFERAVADRLDGLDRVVAVRAWRLEAERALDAVQQRRQSAFR